MKVLFISRGKDQTVITVMFEDDRFEIHLHNDNGHGELWSSATSIADAVMYHKSLCEKCSIKLNM
jgi:hypothetical protein